jgi:hypothetical protein
LDKVERFRQPDDGFERRFPGCFDKEIEAETTEEEVGVQLPENRDNFSL